MKTLIKATRLSLLFTALGLTILVSSHAQRQVIDQEKFLANSAADFIAFEDYESALSIYQTLDSLHPNHPDYIFQLGRCTFVVADKPQSLLHFLRAFQLGHRDPEIYYYLGVAYHFNYDMANATYYLQKYLTMLQDNPEEHEEKITEATHLLTQINQSKELLDKRLSVDIENLGNRINSEHADYVPISLLNDSVLIFTSRRAGSTGGKIAHDGGYYEDIYVTSKIDSATWSVPEPLPGFNGKHHDANVAANKNETALYTFKAKHSGDIYVSRRGSTKNKWSKAKPLKGINSRYWEGSVCLSPDENTLYFSSDRPGGFGGSDLYRAEKDSHGKWSNVQNLGPVINTAFDEDSPYLYKDGKTFFFSSKGHNSIGGYDVFSVKLTDSAAWKDLKNVGFPINTIDDDIYFHLNSAASIGYFTSFRHSNFQEKSIGEKDLFQIKRPHSSPIYFIFKGRIYDDASKEPLPAIVTLKNLEDSTSHDQRLVVDINSGKFRCDLKFENRYKLSVSVGTKVYYSKELYFPYQPDLFETFLDIPLKDIPTFQVKLNDIIKDEPQQSNNVVLDTEKPSTIVLMRKIPYNDPELRNLLLSGKIPMSFRKKLMKELENTRYVDANEEGDPVKNLFEDLQTDDEAFEVPLAFARLESGEKKDIQRFDVKNLLTEENKTEDDSVRFESLPDEERAMINRLADYILNNNSDLEAVDELFYKTLSTKELIKVNRLVAASIQLREGGDDPQVKERLYSFIDLAATKIRAMQTQVPVYNREAWGILYTIDASNFRYQNQARVSFHGLVNFRHNGKPAGRVKLLLTDDHGALYSSKSTDENGSIEFGELLPGRRYRVMVNDYTLAILGYSKYQMTEISWLSQEEDYLKFYHQLSPSEQRSVDRIAALQALEENDNQKKSLEDAMEFGRLDQKEKQFIERIRRYLASKKETDSTFFLDKRDALAYEQMNTEQRDLYNRLITRSIDLSTDDTLFFNKLTDIQKRYIDQLRAARIAKKSILENILISSHDADYWYVLDEINTSFGRNDKPVKISANIIRQNKPHTRSMQVALMDELNQVVVTTETDLQGFFLLPSVPAGKKFKVLINTGENISRLSDYALKNLKIEIGEDDFYATLSLTEKRMVDRIIATNLANQYYENDPTSFDHDQHRYEQLTVEERMFIKRLQDHLFADTVSKNNAYLQQYDNHHYYSNLAIQERDFINRLVIKTQYPAAIKNVAPFELSKQDKRFYDRLTENQKHFIQRMQRDRQMRKDIFAENPVLMADKVLELLDSIPAAQNPSPTKFTVSARVVFKSSQVPAYNLPVVISTGNNEMIGLVTTDSLGFFTMTGLSGGEDHYILAETKRGIFKHDSDYVLMDLRIRHDTDNRNDSIKNGKEHFSPLPLFILYFNFDSHALTTSELQKLKNWLHLHYPVLTQSSIRIAGHTDSVGSETYNNRLSRQRARAIRILLTTQGLDTQSLTTEYHGETKPRYLGSQKSLNRRVELEVVPKH